MATSIRLAPETEHRLDFLASQTGRTKAFYLRELIQRGLGDLEDYYLAADVLERLRKGNEKVYSSAELRDFLELDDREYRLRKEPASQARQANGSTHCQLHGRRGCASEGTSEHGQGPIRTTG